MIFFNAITRAWMLLWLAPVMALQAAAPPTLLKDIGQVTNPYSSDPREYTALGSSGMVVFTARLSDNTSAVCRTDGTPGGTEVLVVFPDYPVHSTSRLGETAALGNEAIFTRRGDNDRWELWKTDGTTAGTTRFALFPGANANGFRGLPSELVSLPGQVIMKAYTPETGEELWTTDGTAEGTFLLRDINPGPLPMPFGYDDKYHRGLAACGGLVYFAAHDDLSGTEVWKTDGTTAGTTLVKDIMPGPAGSSPSGFAFSGGLTYFTATGTATTGNPPQTTPSRDLWRTDGTGEGTVRLRQFRSNDRVSGFFFTGTTTVFVRAHLYNYLGPGSFQEIDGAFLQTDGSPAGTIPFGTISERAFSPHSILAILPDGRFIFESRGIGFFPNHTGRISLFDRGQACTLLEGDLLASAFHDGQFYAMLSPAYGPDAFWKYNPAAAAGQAITRMGNPATQTLQSTGGLLIANNNGPASDPSGVEPWIVHPDSGPALLADLYPGSITESYPAGPDLGYNSNSNADVPENLGGTLVFPAYSTSGVELWRSDGTTAGTTVLRDIIPGPEGHYHIIIHTDAPYLAIGPRSGQLLFFERWAQGIAEPREIWITDGTTAGTVKVHEEHPASGSPLLPWQRGVWWLNNISSNRNALWLSDGTPSGTRAVKEITHYFGQDKPSANFDGTTYAILTNSQKAVSLWEIHPDPARVRLLYDFKKPGDAAVNIRAMPVFQGALWFFVQRITGTTGTAEIWRMSPGGTPEWLLTLPQPGYASDFGKILAGTNLIYFNATDGSAEPGPVLWVTDGTVSGTRRATPASSNLIINAKKLEAVVSSDRLFTVHRGDDAGMELWTCDGTPGGTQRLTGAIPPPSSQYYGGRADNLTIGGDGYLYFDYESMDNNQLIRRIWRVTTTAPGLPEPFGDLPENQLYSGGFYFLPRSLFWAHDRLYARCYVSDSGNEFYWWPAPAPATPYSTWTTGQGLTLGPADPLADPDMDGQPNLLEFLTGTLPTSAASLAPPTVVPQVFSGSTQATMTFRRMESSGLNVIVESSLDCLSWQSEYIITTDGTATAQPGRRSAIFSRTGSNPESISIVTLPAESHQKKFLRIRAAQP